MAIVRKAGDVPVAARMRFYDGFVPGKKNECWPWLKAKNPDGYGKLFVADSYVGAHRIAYVLAGRRILRRHGVLHACDNPPCVNPKHLYSGTHRRNMQDMAKRRRSNKGKRINYRSRPPRGEACNLAKLTVRAVQMIRVLAAAGRFTNAAIGAAFGVSKHAIRDIAQRRTWRHIP